jgi:ferritin
MILKQSTIDILNYRINQEELSSRIYEQMSLWLNNAGFLNFSKLYKIYSEEELKHSTWSKNFLLDYGITPTLKPLPAPMMEYSSLKEILDATLEHEIDITNQCEELAATALKEGNHVLYTLATKYCSEQHEEIGKAITNLDIFKLSSDQLVIDSYVGENLL